MPSNSSLSAVADDRKARLASLRNLKRKQPADETVPPESTRSPSPPGEKNQPQPLRISGRNYDVEARGPKLGFESGPNEGLDKPTLEEQAAQIEEESRRRAEEEAKDDKGIDLFKLQPKKPNWDLKRDLDKKMKILNVRTDNAIARLGLRLLSRGSAAGSCCALESGRRPSLRPRLLAGGSTLRRLASGDLDRWRWRGRESLDAAELMEYRRRRRGILSDSSSMGDTGSLLR
ncbi:coiled-coil domain-containing protein 12 [Geosmithia morbida]|uniref:Coiled-coil domain-containing protein 12 n=1 Tax=Geosmithia morbida TaxID=1094350 RepID=A0A9P4Z072_9HYPO|nr:coiled-coil domain-containing protein 12 [Geosmithia morbida]KAF4126293.1 coiled-coil domain-containing protein 12 [Geosmithia morbida]